MCEKSILDYEQAESKIDQYRALHDLVRVAVTSFTAWLGGRASSPSYKEMRLRRIPRVRDKVLLYVDRRLFILKSATKLRVTTTSRTS